MVRRRWALSGGAPKGLTLVVDSTVVVRYGRNQAAAEVGYNPKKRGRPSHHPLVAFIRDTGDCLGVRWRGADAHTAAGAAEWIEELVERLRAAGVEDITVRLDKGFFSRRMVRTLDGLGVSFTPQGAAPPQAFQAWGSWRFSAKGEAVLPGEGLWTAVRQALGARGSSRSRPRGPWSATERWCWTPTRSSARPTCSPTSAASKLIRRGAATTLARWSSSGSRSWSRLSAGRTAVDDMGGNALLWSLAVVAYQTLHTLCENHLCGSWRTGAAQAASPLALQAAREAGRALPQEYLQLLRGEPVRRRLLAALRTLDHAIPPPVPGRALRSPPHPAGCPAAILAPESPPSTKPLHVRPVCGLGETRPGPTTLRFPPPRLPVRADRPPVRHNRPNPRRVAGSGLSISGQTRPNLRKQTKSWLPPRY